MKKFTLVLLLITCGISLAQSFELYKQDTINVVDAEGRKQGKWIIFNKVKNLPDYPPDAKVEEGKFVDNKKAGPWKEYYPNGTLKNKITFSNNRPDGYAVMYHENGKIAEEGVWKNNRWVGVYKLYHDNGQVAQEFNFNAVGKREGNQKYYYENGQLMIEGDWKGGKEAGVVKEYYENGDLKAEKNFADGNIDLAKSKTYQPKKPIPVSTEPVAKAEPKITIKPDEKPNIATNVDLRTISGRQTLYNKNKQISKDGEFDNGRLINGKVYHYTPDGILLRIAIYKDGKYSGDGVIED
jgi:antitoxin component YwqK of YwqJK toxin-antitoxin module